MSYPQQSNFMFFGPDSGSNDNALAQAQSVGAGAYQQGHMGMASDDGSAAAAAAAAVAAATGGNSGVNAYFVNSNHALMAAAAAAGHAGMYPTGMVDAHHHQRSGSLSGATVVAAATAGVIGADHRRSPSGSVRSGANNVEHAQRRATHNAIERARRESLNGQFQDLASAVPALSSVRRPSKATIVEKSLEHIKTFRSRLDARDQCIAKLQMRNLALHDEVNRLRKQLGLEPLDNDSEDLLPETISEAPEDHQLLMGSPQPNTTAASGHGALLQPHPVASPHQHKRRQQSLDLGAISSRPMLRVQTSNITKHSKQRSAASSSIAGAHMSQALIAPAPMAATAAPAVGGDYSSGDGGSPLSSSASPLNISPLSAPVHSHSATSSVSHFPFSTMQATSGATAAAVMAAAMQQQLFTTNIVATMTQQQQQHGVATTAGGYSMAPQPSGLGLIDMNNLSDVFTANNNANSDAAASGMVSMPVSIPIPMSANNALANNGSPTIVTLEGGSPSISMAQ
ncbi:hypothetical protein EV175_005466 [Coemansia sp. RSA 1933]|nr:hypothetical protein EV175_005466 [Coemansia sp. RSA 1933]